MNFKKWFGGLKEKLCLNEADFLDFGFNIASLMRGFFVPL